MEKETHLEPEEEVFIILVDHVEFKLNRDQINVDSPNYFTTAFSESSQFIESKTKTIKLGVEFDHRLFDYIRRYLTKKRFLPLPELVPGGISKEVAMLELIDYADYLQLDILKEELLHHLIHGKSRVENIKELRSKGWTGVVELEDLISGKQKLKCFTEGSGSIGLVQEKGNELPVLIHLSDMRFNFKEFRSYFDVQIPRQRVLLFLQPSCDTFPKISIEGFENSCDLYFTPPDINQTYVDTSIWTHWNWLLSKIGLPVKPLSLLSNFGIASTATFLKKGKRIPVMVENPAVKREIYPFSVKKILNPELFNVELKASDVWVSVSVYNAERIGSIAFFPPREAKPKPKEILLKLEYATVEIDNKNDLFDCLPALSKMAL